MTNFDEPTELTLDALKHQLKSAGIDISMFGKGQAKTLEDLQQEIESGETVLIYDKEGKLLRKVSVCGAEIYYTDPNGKKYRLKEEKQIFKDGRERHRDLGHAVSEKMMLTENPRETMLRGIREELGIEGDITLTESNTEEELLTSPSYPGLNSQYIRHGFVATLKENQFRPEGYIEEQGNKTTYFVWEEIK